MHAALLIANHICYKQINFLGSEKAYEIDLKLTKKKYSINEKDLYDKKVLEVGKNIAKEYNGECFKERPLGFYDKFVSAFFESDLTNKNPLPSYTKLFDEDKKEHRKSQNRNKLNQKDCLKANDYEGCMNFQMKQKESNNLLNPNEIDCINFICTPSEARLYKTDNLGLKVIPGYDFIDQPYKRSAAYISQPYKLKVNGTYGRYIHIQRIIRFYSEGYSGSLTTTRGINSDSPPIINYRPGRYPGIRQTMTNHIFDCEDKSYARFNKNEKLIKTKTISGKKKKWHGFDEIDFGYTQKQGIRACKKPLNSILLLNISPFKKFESKQIKNSIIKKNMSVNCNSPVWKNKPRCN